MFREAVRDTIPNVILVHNHPSGDAWVMDREIVIQAREGDHDAFARLAAASIGRRLRRSRSSRLTTWGL